MKAIFCWPACRQGTVIYVTQLNFILQAPHVTLISLHVIQLKITMKLIRLKKYFTDYYILILY